MLFERCSFLGRGSPPGDRKHLTARSRLTTVRLPAGRTLSGARSIPRSKTLTMRFYSSDASYVSYKRDLPAIKPWVQDGDASPFVFNKDAKHLGTVNKDNFFLNPTTEVLSVFQAVGDIALESQ